jgi:hypothetical protein
VHLWAPPGYGASNSSDNCYAMVVDQDKNLFMTGYFSAKVDFDPDGNYLYHQFIIQALRRLIVM